MFSQGQKAIENLVSFFMVNLTLFSQQRPKKPRFVISNVKSQKMDKILDSRDSE